MTDVTQLQQLNIWVHLLHYFFCRIIFSIKVASLKYNVSSGPVSRMTGLPAFHPSLYDLGCFTLLFFLLVFIFIWFSKWTNFIFKGSENAVSKRCWWVMIVFHSMLLQSNFTPGFKLHLLGICTHFSLLRTLMVVLSIHSFILFFF